MLFIYCLFLCLFSSKKEGRKVGFALDSTEVEAGTIKKDSNLDLLDEDDIAEIENELKDEYGDEDDDLEDDGFEYLTPFKEVTYVFMCFIFCIFCIMYLFNDDKNYSFMHSNLSTIDFCSNKKMIRKHTSDCFLAVVITF